MTGPDDLELPGMPSRPDPTPVEDDPSTAEQRRALVLIAAHLAHRQGAGWSVHAGQTRLSRREGWLYLNARTLEALRRRGLVGPGPTCELTAAGLAALDRLTVRAPLRTPVREG